jgi:replicative DNA helicase
MERPPAPEEVQNAVYTALESQALAGRTIEHRKGLDRLGVPTFISSLDEYFRPMWPGNLVSVIGRPSNYKSGVMQWIARNAAQRLKFENIEDRVVVYCTWEQSVEEYMLLELGSSSGNDAEALAEGVVADEAGLQRAMINLATRPLWIIGHSIERRRRRPSLTMSNIEQALRWVDGEWGIQPELIVLDYLQRITPERGDRDFRVQNSRNVDRAKDLALAMGCPVMLGVQAKRDVEERRNKLPGMADGAETSNVEHSSDAILSVHMPKMSELQGFDLANVYGIPLNVHDNLLLLQVVKRKFGKAGAVFPLFVKPEVNSIAPHEIDYTSARYT